MANLTVEPYKPRHSDWTEKLFKLIPRRWIRMSVLCKCAGLRTHNVGFYVGLLVQQGLVERALLRCGDRYERYCRRVNVEKAVAL